MRSILTADVPTPNRSFGLLFGVVLSLVSLWMWRRGAAAYPLAAVAAVAFFGAAALRPPLLTPLTRWWMRFALLLNLIVSPLVLGVLFFLVFTPIALTMRIARRDALKLRLDPGAASYWERRTPPGPAKRSMHEQF